MAFVDLRDRGFEEVYETYGTMVYRLAMVYRGNHADAEDVTQEVFVRLFRKGPAFHDKEHEKRWLLRVTANLCLDQLRGPWRSRIVELEEAGDTRSSGGDELVNMVLSLPKKYKGPIHLHYFEGYSVEEISRILRISVSAVKMRLKRGRELLKLELEDKT